MARLLSKVAEVTPWPDLEGEEKPPWAFAYLLENRAAQRTDPTLVLPWLRHPLCLHEILLRGEFGRESASAMHVVPDLDGPRHSLSIKRSEIQR